MASTAGDPCTHSNDTARDAAAGSSPYTVAVPSPRTLACSVTAATTARTPGVRSVAPMVPAGMVPNCLPVTMRSPFSVLSSAELNDALSPCANTATKATSPMPIIRAAAVAAVRAGLRVALRRARVPDSPGRCSSGQPMTRARNGTAYRLSEPMAANTRNAPSAITSRRRVESPPPVSAMTMTATPPMASTAAMMGVKREMRDGGISAPSRSAAMGGTRLARNAGMSAASTATPTPTSRAVSAMPTVSSAPATGMPPGRNSLNTPTSRAANPNPAASPSNPATRPMTRASPTTDHITCLRLAPMVRSRPSSRRRCATVMENVLKMMNAATNSAMTPNASSAGLRNLSMASLVRAACLAASCAPVLTSTVRGSLARSVRARASAEMPGSAATATELMRPSRLNHRCTS